MKNLTTVGRVAFLWFGFVAAAAFMLIVYYGATGQEAKMWLTLVAVVVAGFMAALVEIITRAG